VAFVQTRFWYPAVISDHKPLDQHAPSLEKQEVESTGRGKNRFVILAMLAAAGIIVPGIVAAVPDGHDGGPIVTGPGFNLSSVDTVNSTIPAKYQATPEPVIIGVAVSDTLIPGPKGEMQAGPRTIGFAADPVVLLVLAVAILAGVSGFWYLARRRPEEPEQSTEEEEK
jgi:hypothetical protein